MSDWEITAQSKLVKYAKMLEEGDSVMADCGLVLTWMTSLLTRLYG